MGNLASKTTKSMPSAAIKTSKPQILSSKEEIFGREIMKNIQLKEVPIKLTGNQDLKNESNRPKTKSNFTTRTQLNQQTDGTLSWQELPEIFNSVETNSKKFRIETSKIEKLKKYFSLPNE